MSCSPKEVKVDKLCALNSEIKNAKICNLNVDFINGQSTNPDTICRNNFNTSSAPFTQIQNGPSGPVQPINPGTFDQEVWDALWQEILCQGYAPGGIQDRLQCGRLQLDLINDFHGCKVCPPTYLEGCQPFCTPGNASVKGIFSAGGNVLTVMSTDNPLTGGAAVVLSPSKFFLGYLGSQTSGAVGGPGVYNFEPKNPIPGGVQNLEVLGEICECPTSAGICPMVPLNVWGLKAYSPTNQVPCNPGVTGATGGFVTHVLTNLTFSLDIKNLTLNKATRSVYVMILFGYRDSNGIIQKRIHYIGSSQYNATIDTLIGERYGETIPLPTDQLRFMAQEMPDPNNSSIVEMVVFAEDGLEIVEGSKIARDLPSCSSSSKSFRSTVKSRQGPEIVEDRQASGESVAVPQNAAPPAPPPDSGPWVGVGEGAGGQWALSSGGGVEERKRAAEDAVKAYLLAEYWAKKAAEAQGQQQ